MKFKFPASLINKIWILDFNSEKQLLLAFFHVALEKLLLPNPLPLLWPTKDPISTLNDSCRCQLSFCWNNMEDERLYTKFPKIITVCPPPPCAWTVTKCPVFLGVTKLTRRKYAYLANSPHIYNKDSSLKIVYVVTRMKSNFSKTARKIRIRKTKQTFLLSKIVSWHLDQVQ